MKLSPIERTPSRYNPGQFDIKLSSRSQLTPTSLNFSYEKPGAQGTQEVKIKELKDIPEGSRVTVTAKVIGKEESVLQKLQSGRTLTRTTFTIADESASVDLTLWGPPEQVNPSSTYQFTNLAVKIFEKKKLSTTLETSIKRKEDIKNVTAASFIKTKIEKVKIIGVSIYTVSKCCFCNSIIQLNPSLTSVKCMKCHKRQLSEAVKKSTKCEINAKRADETVSNFFVPHEELVALTGDIPNDDKEMFILNCKTVEVQFASSDSLVATQIKKLQ